MVVHDFSALVSAELFASSIRQVTVDILFAMNNFHELGIQKVILTLCNSWNRSLGVNLTNMCKTPTRSLS